MLTPQEVADRAFSKASFGGYNMAMVDEFLDQITNDYTTLYKENTTLKAKMKMLADKVEEYRSTEDAMRKALLSAQKMADQIVAEAEAKREAIERETEKSGAEQLAAIRREVESEELRLAAARNSTASYITKLKELFDREQDYLASLSELEAEAPKPDRVADTAQAIGTAVEKAVAEAIEAEEKAAEEVPQEQEESAAPDQEAPQEPAAPAEPADDEPTLIRGAKKHWPEQPARETTRRIDFKNLQFGKDYDIH